MLGERYKTSNSIALTALTIRLKACLKPAFATNIPRVISVVKGTRRTQMSTDDPQLATTRNLRSDDVTEITHYSASHFVVHFAVFARLRCEIA